ncbi:hypothetical protein [Mycobacterium sp. HNNTM2301]|uniref:hypothetical protein n=1 Tax=Mycobacterium hainanense TaxID=3289775 RepID=UPI0035A69EEB
MAFRRLPIDELFDFDLRLWDQHTRYDGRWTDEQLKAIVERLDLPADKKLSYAIASFARSVVLDGKTDNFGIHFSRDRNKYADRYLADGDPYNTYYFTTKAADWLQTHYGCEQLKGTHIPNVPGRESAEYCSQELMDTIGDLVDPLEARARAQRPEVIILRHANKKNARYSDTPETRAMRNQLWVFNDHLAQRDIRRQGHMVEIPLLRRVFNLSFDRGGRLYCWGESYQGLPKEQRLEFTEVVDGAVQPLVEIDYSAHHFHLAYAQVGKNMLPGDPYDIPGFDRALVKLAGLISFNAQDKRDAAGAVMGESGCSYDEAKAVIRAVRRKHYHIKDYFYSDAGARLMRIDSDMAVEIMNRVMTITGRCPLPMHDSFLVPVCDAGVLAQLMEAVAAEYGVRADLSITRAHSDEKDDNTSSIPTPYMADHSTELLISLIPQTASDTSDDPVDPRSASLDTDKEAHTPPVETSREQPPELTAKAGGRHIHVGGPYPCQKRRGYVGILPGKVWTALARLTGDWANGTPSDYATVREWDKLMYGASEFRDTFKLFAPKAADLPPLFPLNSFEAQEIAARKVYRNVGPVDPETEHWLFLDVLAEQHEEDAAPPRCAQIGSDKIVQYARYIRRQERENAAAREKAKRKALREYLRKCRAARVKIERPERSPKLTGME